MNTAQEEKKQDLESWLKSNKLNKLLSVLTENDITELEDLEALENEADIEELIGELKVKVILRKKFKKAVLKLINSNMVTQEPVPGSQQQSSHNRQNRHTKNNDDERKTDEGRPKKPNYSGYVSVPKVNKLDLSRRSRTMMVIGATGTGKTTLLNSMMNYLWNVEYDDKYRYKLVYEIKKSGGQADSQTDTVTAYYLDPPALDYQLTVIDTPGYGDTRGIKQDEKITKNVKKFFETKIQQIDVICFVIRAPQARLTPTQKYIFNQVLGIFGNDIKENIFVLLTFADNKKPPAIAALKAGRVPYKESFKLNNSAFELDEDDDEDEIFGKLYWEMGIKSFAKFFKKLDTVKTKSLSLTKKVLTRREQLEIFIEGIQPTINQGFSILEGIRKQIIFINKYADLINANKDFMVETTLSKARHVSNNGTCTTTC
eukprot:456238_1